MTSQVCPLCKMPEGGTKGLESFIEQYSQVGQTKKDGSVILNKTHLMTICLKYTKLIYSVN
jgi:hypothetical protein